MKQKIFTTVCLASIALAAQAQQVVNIDIDPWDAGNEIDPSLNGPIVLSIFSSIGEGGTDFDASQIDPGSLELGIGRAASFMSPAIYDIDGDTDADAVVAFRTQDAAIFCGDTELSVTGQTFGGDFFVGTDNIYTTECDNGSCHPGPSERFRDPVILGDSWSDQPDDWWSYSAEVPAQDFQIYAQQGEELGRQRLTPGRGHVRNMQSNLDASPTADSLIVFAGTNDVAHWAHAGEVKFAMADVIYEAKTRANLQDIVIVSPVPWGNYSGWGGWDMYKQAEQEEYMAWLAAFAADENIPLLDVYALMGDPTYPEDLAAELDSGDGLHTNTLGALYLADQMDVLIRAAREGAVVGLPNTVAQNFGWDDSQRAYDGVTVTGNQLAWNRSVSERQSLPVDTFFPATGQWYAEFKIVSMDPTSDARIGFIRSATHDPAWAGGLGDDGPQPAIDLADGRGVSNSNHYGYFDLEVEAGAVVGIAYDADLSLTWVNLNGHWQETGALNALPENATGGISVVPASDYRPAIETTGTSITVEIPATIPAGHVPAGFSILQ